MRFLSMFSGIEAASVAWEPLGWKAAAVCEIDKFASAVLAHHYKDVPNLGNVEEADFDAIGPIDLAVFGSPCQSYSIAGKRLGLDDPRGNLALVGGRVVYRKRPRWFVFENVPGILSSDNGWDFGTLLAAFAGYPPGSVFEPPADGWRNSGTVKQASCDGYGLAWRVLDAQYVRVDGFGRAVPQRRRRVFVVGHFGDWRRAAAVLFERASLSGHPPPRREAGKNAAPTLAARTRGGGGFGTDVATAQTAHGGTGRIDFESETFGAHALRAERFDASEDGTGRGTPLVPVSVAPTLRAGGNATGGDRPYGTDVDTCDALLPICFDETQITSAENRCNPQPGDPCHPLARGARPPTHAVLHSGENNASSSQANSGALLRGVREALGEKAFAEWGLGILDTLQPAEILRSALHGSELRQAAFSRSWVVCCALGSPFSRAEGAVQSLREAGSEGRASQGLEPSEQFAGELGAYLSELSQPGAQAERFMRDLWLATEGLGLLRHALSAVQAARRSSRHKDTAEAVMPLRSTSEREGSVRQALHADETSWRVRRLLVEECEFLQGFPRGYTDIPYRGKPAADGPRYKALGNSFAVNVVRWLGQRIQMVEDTFNA